MGVMECRRNGCEHVMCRRHCYLLGYICDECFGELIDYLVSVDYGVRDESIDVLAKRFMDHSKEFKFQDRNARVKFAEEMADRMFPIG